MWWPLISAFLICLTQLLFIICAAGEDYYQLLGVAKDADERTIRRAFKKIAIIKHPDRDSDNPNAHNDFIKINKAYEVLKDPDLRRKYDQHGEEGLDESKHAGQKYESWQFYNDKFGIYDDDPQIVTLSRQDFQQKVTDSGDFWFINFYSTYCSHCHDLAPTWREFAIRMEGIVKIGAVNCAEDPHLCQSQNVRAYPSLVAYPDHLFFQGRREIEPLVEFITSKLRVELIQVTSKNIESLSKQWEPYAARPWLIDFCDEMENCFKQADRRMIAYMLDKVVNVGTIMCYSENKDKLCDKLQNEGLAFYPAGKIDKGHEIVSNLLEINTFDLKEVQNEVLKLLPDIQKLEEESYRSLLDKLEESRKEEQLVLFVSKKSEALNELKKLASLLSPTTQFKLADCSELADGCEGLRLGPLPRLVLFRAEGNYLIYYGKTITLSDVRSFLASTKKSTMISLTESMFEEIRVKQESKDATDIWLVDMFAPWCHPCMLAINELKNLPHVLEGRRLRVGIINCDVHKKLCFDRGVNNYPTTLILFGQLNQRLVGFHSWDQVVDFVQESLHPSVLELDPAKFDEFVVQKPANEIFVVDFFLASCPPCRELKPQFQKLARIVQEETDIISFGAVDCEVHRHLCQLNGLRSYPTIRVYANGAQYDYPANWWRTHESMRQWLQGFLPTNVETVDERRLIELMEGDTKMPIVIDFFANWCQPCIVFASVFDEASRMLENRVHFAKIDCAVFPNACAKAGISAYPTVKIHSPGRRKLNGGVRIHAQDAIQLVDIINRVLGEYSYNQFNHIERDEL